MKSSFLGFMKIVNHGSSFYYPEGEVATNLKKAVIFTENNKKRMVPNGAVFQYNSKDYNPEILRSDVGCGITAGIIRKREYDSDFRQEVLKVVNDIGQHIGQGNHFLDFTTSHPYLRTAGLTDMVFLHTDFNSENIIPSTYQEAKDLENRAIEMRESYLDKLFSKLGISFHPYMDWTHNFVEKDGNSFIYRKGAIDLSRTGNIGALALNPLDGIYLYMLDNEEEFNSMQHGTGRKSSKGQLFDLFASETYGIAQGFWFDREKTTFSEISSVANSAYNSMDLFLNEYGLKSKPIGACVPKLVVKTKSKQQ